MDTFIVEEDEENYCHYALQLASSSVLPMALMTATELGLLNILAESGPGALLSSVQIASHLPTRSPDEPALIDRLLRLLASHSIVTCSELTVDDHGEGNPVQRLYGLAPVAKYFIRNEDGVSLTPMLQLIQDKIMVNMWYHMKDAVLEGGLPFNRAYGMNASQFVSQDATLLQLFRGSMNEFNCMFMKKILATYDGFDGIETLVDVGGGDGTILNMIVSMHPQIKGINFDLVHIIEKSPTLPGIKNVAGDMFIHIPKGDAIFMKWILHNWNDEHCLKIMRNCYDALPDCGKIMIVEMVAPECPKTSISDRSKLQVDLFMLNMNPGGKERTETEFKCLAERAGFCNARVACSAYCFSLVEFYKRI